MGVTDAGGAMGSSVVGIVRNPIKSASNLAKDYVSYGKNDWKNWNPAWYFGTKTGEGLVDQAVSSYNLGAEYGLEGVMYGLGQGTTIVATTGVSAYGSQAMSNGFNAIKSKIPDILNNKIMPKISKSKLFNGNNGYGYKIGKNTEMLYQNPNVKGVTFLSYKNPKTGTKFRIDWDPKHGFHKHPPGHK